MKGKKWKKYTILILAGLVMTGVVIWSGGNRFSDVTEIREAKNVAEVLMILSDGFTVPGLLFFCFGALLAVSTTGMFDIFSYAFRKCAHALIPGMVHDTVGKYYEYKMGKAERRKEAKTEWSVLLVGCGFLVIAVCLTGAWYLAV